MGKTFVAETHLHHIQMQAGGTPAPQVVPPAQVVSPFQKPKFKAIKAMLLDSDGDGVFDSVLFTARKGKKKLSRTISL